MSTVVRKLKPRFTPLPEFNPNQTKPSRVAQHLAAGADYKKAINETDREFKAAEKAALEKARKEAN